MQGHFYLKIFLYKQDVNCLILIAVLISFQIILIDAMNTGLSPILVKLYKTHDLHYQMLSVNLFIISLVCNNMPIQF